MKFGKYTAEKKLGKGAMGEVFYGIHPNLDIPIAIKTLSSSLVDDELFIDRFIREAKIAARIKHENAISIYDADNDGDNYFIVMEYVSGGNLEAKIKEEGKIREKEALSITRQIASALQAAAKFKIIHRDIKPENIMLSEDGVPKLADLGIARQNTSSQENTTMTGVIVGTPNYLAPEQAHDSKSVDARADIYSLGCSLFRMLSGQCPYSGGTPLGVMMKHVNEPVPDIKNLEPDISVATSGLIKKMMAKKPEDRPQSAGELIDLIDNLNSSDSLKILDQQKSPKTQEQTSVEVSKKSLTMAGILVSFIVVLSIAVALIPAKPSDSGTTENAAQESVEKSPLQNESLKSLNISESINITDLGIEMLPVKATSFMMGAREGEMQTEADETLHEVTLTEDYSLSKLEVSIAAWKVFVSDTKYISVSERRGWSGFYNNQGDWNGRVENVNWMNIGLEDDDAISMITFDDCIEFCRWLTKREREAGRLPEGFEYTLPTEAQWENACRAGSTSPFANDMNYDDLGWVRENSSGRVHKRGLKQPNAWGFYDMHGNVWEFCLDRSEGRGFFDVSTNTYENGIIDPLSTQGTRVIYRGGSYPDRATQMCRAASRGHSLLSYSCNNHGFRLCLSKTRN